MGLFTSRRQPNRVLAPRPDDPPASPSIYDDEFNGSSLAPKWTNVLGTIDTVNPVHPYASVVGKHRVSFNDYRPGWLMCQPVPNVTFGIYQPVTFDTDCCVYARMSFNTRYQAVSNNDSDLAIHLNADAGGSPDQTNLVYMNLNESDANTVFARAGRIVANVSTIAGTTRNVGPQSAGTDSLVQNACYILIQKLGTVYNCAIGEYHGNWLWVAQQTIAFTPAWIGLVFANVNNNAPGNAIMGVDYVRYVSGKALP